MRISRLVVTDPAAQFGLRDVGGYRSDGTEVPALQIQQRDGRYGMARFIDLPLGEHRTRSAIKMEGFGPGADPADEALLRDAARSIDGIVFWKSDAPLR